MRWAQIGALPPLLGLLVGACAAPAPGQTGSAPPEQAQPGRTLVVAGRAERPSLSPRPFQNLGLTAGLDGRMFNAHLTIDNDAGLPVPYLAENVPQLNTDTWRVLPDGSMETRYRLKENLVWHDGHPMTSDDFVFAYRVLWNPAFGLNSSPPGSLIAEVTATDPRTVLIRWSSTYPQADSNGAEAVPPFPRHLLEQDYQAQDPEAFMANPFWNAGYVHAGPYRLERLEPGVFVEGVAFDQHVLGKPRIPRIRQLIMPDPNTVLANLLSGDVHLTTGDSIRFTDGETLRAQWGDRGQVLNFPNLYRITQFQYKPADASTRAFTDLRVRKALHHGFNFDAVNEALYGGRAQVAYGPIRPTVSYYPELEKAVAKYPYDPRKVEQYMAGAGFSKGSDGVWAHPALGRMEFEDNVLANPDSNAELSIKADTWRRLGFDVKEVTWAPAIGADRETRATFPGLSTTSTGGSENSFANYKSGEIPRAPQWRGGNRGGWPTPPEFDRLVNTIATDLNRDARTRAVIDANKIMTETVAVINLYWKLNAVGFVNGLTGPRLTDPEGDDWWNLHEWEFK